MRIDRFEEGLAAVAVMARRIETLNLRILAAVAPQQRALRDMAVALRTLQIAAPALRPFSKFAPALRKLGATREEQ